MTRRQNLLQYSLTFKDLKLNIPAKFASWFPDEEEEIGEDNLNLSVGKNVRNAPLKKAPRSESKTGQIELKKLKSPVFPIIPSNTFISYKYSKSVQTPSLWFYGKVSRRWNDLIVGMKVQICNSFVFRFVDPSSTYGKGQFLTFKFTN